MNSYENRFFLQWSHLRSVLGVNLDFSSFKATFTFYQIAIETFFSLSLIQSGDPTL